MFCFRNNLESSWCFFLIYRISIARTVLFMPESQKLLVFQFRKRILANWGVQFLRESKRIFGNFGLLILKKLEEHLGGSWFLFLKKFEKNSGAQMLCFRKNLGFSWYFFFNSKNLEGSNVLFLKESWELLVFGLFSKDFEIMLGALGVLV